MDQFIADFPDEYKNEASFRRFLTAHSGYLTTARLSQRRRDDFDYLRHETYLDWTGAGLFGTFQRDAHQAILAGRALGNPHSLSPASERSTQLVEAARQQTLGFFKANPDEYCVIFTANASAALKLVAEAFKFRRGSRFLQLLDAHSSVTGMRCFAQRAGAKTQIASMTPGQLRLDANALRRQLRRRINWRRAPKLFAFTAQSNFTGVKHSLDWISHAQARGWTVAVDAAAYAPTNQLDLGVHKPDFVAGSFYKMFGYPTGVGFLLARHDALAQLERPWFAGGTIVAASTQGYWYKLAAGEAGFEDGTVNYQGLAAVTIGLQYLEAVGIEMIQTRVECLTIWLLTELGKLRHSNGQPLVEIYGPTNAYDRGGTIAFNILDPEGHIVDERAVEQQALEQNISLRVGCFCNAIGEKVFNIATRLLRRAKRLADSMTSLTPLLEELGMQSGGAIRLSLGQVSNFRDLEHALALVQSFQDITIDCCNLRPRDHC